MAGKERSQGLYECVQFAMGLALWIAIGFYGPSGSLAIIHDPKIQIWGLGEGSPWALLVLLLAASFLAMHFKFGMGSNNYYVSFDISFALVALFLVSPAAGAGLALLSAGFNYFDRLRREEAPRRVIRDLSLGTSGNRLLRIGFAWIAYSAAGGRIPPHGHSTEFWAALLAFAVYVGVNNIFFVPSEYLRRSDLKQFWREAVTVDLAYSFTICTLGYLLSIVAIKIGILSFLVLGVFVLAGSWLLSTLTKTKDELKNRVEDLTILSRVSAAASSDLDVMPMVESFTRSLAQWLPADGIGVVFYQRYATTIYLVQVEGEKSRSTYLPEERRFQYDQLPLSEPSRRLGERLFEFLQPLETAPFMIPPSVFGLPLLHGGEPFGGIVVYSYQSEVPLEKKQELLELCAQSLEVALENCFLHLQAIQDPLTGLYNRSYFLYRLEEELSFSSRHRAPFALLMIDLDDFKAVNDHLGHAMGDKVLHRIGDLLRRTLRREDVPARYGGDEFIVLLLGCKEKAAHEKAERIRSSFATQALPKEEAGGLAMGCSISLLHSDHLKGEQDLPTLLRKLDEALYGAKQAGKNRVIVVQ
ncbi:MAG: GGDEF domain-containing protein [Acidobacteriota bacterium]